MRAVKAWMVVAALAALAACGGGDEAPAGAEVAGAVVKGPVQGSTLCAYALANGVKGASLPLTARPGASGSITAAGCYLTGSDGTYAVLLPSGASGDVLLEASGGSFCSTEAPIANGACAGGGTVVAMGASVMSAAVTATPGSAASVFVTPLTTAAVADAGGTLTVSGFNSRFTRLAGLVVGPTAAITPASPPTPANQPYLAQVASFLASGGTLANAVSTLQQGSTSFSTPTPPAAPPASPPASPPPATTAPGTTPVTGTPATGTPSTSGNVTTTATINAALVGMYTKQFNNDGAGCGARCSYADQQLLSFSITSAGALSLPGKVLTGPFHRSFGGTPNLAEIIWLDADNRLEYAVTNNQDGVFREMNLGDAASPGTAGIPKFLGQFRTQQSPGAAALAALAGTYPVAYQYRGAAVPWTEVVIGTDGSITFNGGSGYRPNVTSATTTAVDNFTSCCGTVSVRVNFDINQGTDANGVNSGDRILLSKDSTGALRSIEYDTGHPGVIADDSGVRLGTVAALAAHDGTPPPTGSGINGTLGTTVLNTAIGRSFGSANAFTIETNAVGGTNAGWLVGVSRSSALTPGTYDCRVAPSLNIRIEARLTNGGPVLGTANGGRCTITIDSYTHDTNAVTSLVGSFRAEILGTENRQDGTPLTVVNGVFRVAP